MKKTPKQQNLIKILGTVLTAVLVGVLVLEGCYLLSKPEKLESAASSIENVFEPLKVYGLRFVNGVKKSDVKKILSLYELPEYEEPEKDEDPEEEQERYIETYTEEDKSYPEPDIHDKEPDGPMTAEEIAAEQALILRVERYMAGITDVSGNTIKKERNKAPSVEIVDNLDDTSAGNILTIYPSEEELYSKSLRMTSNANANSGIPLISNEMPAETEEETDFEYITEDSVTDPADIVEKSDEIKKDMSAKGSPLDYTPAERAKNVIMLARLIYGEARNIANRGHWAAVCWCALNRLDSGEYGNTLKAVLTKTNKDSKKRADQQFTGYSRYDPSDEDLDKYTAILEVANDVYQEWEDEHASGSDSPRRTLPKRYYYYFGTGPYNYFVETATERHNKDKSNAYDWDECGNPYEQELKDKVQNYVVSDHEKLLMAKQVWHKARGLKSKMERAAVVWCILNRLESPVYEDTIVDILRHPIQFARMDTPGSLPDSSYMEIVNDVVDRWDNERGGAGNVGRVLPKTYIYFHGTEDEKTNLYYNNPFQRHHWRWKLDNPYA